MCLGINSLQHLSVTQMIGSWPSPAALMFDVVALERAPAGHTLLRDHLLPVLKDEDITKVTKCSSTPQMIPEGSVAQVAHGGEITPCLENRGSEFQSPLVYDLRNKEDEDSTKGICAKSHGSRGSRFGSITYTHRLNNYQIEHVIHLLTYFDVFVLGLAH